MRRTRAIAILIAALGLGCMLEPDAGPGGFGDGPAPTGITAGATDDGDGGETGVDPDGADAADSGGSEGVDAGDNAAGSDAIDDGGDGSSGGDEGVGPLDDGGSGDDGADGDDGAPAGPACNPVVDLAVTGAGGPANANQNCPTTAYTTQVADSPGAIAKISVVLDADVATTSEFTATLRSPLGTEVTLFSQHGGPFTDDFIGTHFDDAAPAPIAGAAAPRTGCYAPDGSLDAFVGQPADGQWTLTVQTCLYAVDVHAWELRMSF
jgi:hypothetical protein